MENENTRSSSLQLEQRAARMEAEKKEKKKLLGQITEAKDEDEDAMLSLLTPMVIQLEEHVGGMQAYIKEMKVATCVQFEQRAARMQAEIKEMKKLLGQITEAKDDDEDATLYFRVGGLACNTEHVVEYDATWFAVSPRGVVDREGLFEEPHRVYEKPPRDGWNRNTPLAVGPYIFLISDVVDDDGKSLPRRRVLYINTQKNEKVWKKAPSVAGEHVGALHFIVADDRRIYSFGPVDKGNNSIRVSYIDSQDPLKGWHPVEAIPCSSSTGLFSLFSILASTIVYDTTTIKGRPRRRARRALLFAHDCRITYDFVDKKYEISKEWLYCDPRCSVCPDGGDVYFLIQDRDGSVHIKVYDHRERVWCVTPVKGLDKYLPVSCSDGSLPPSKLVHLGNDRMCLVWTIYDGPNIQVHCTKFSVVTVQQEEGGYHATNVSSQVYKVKGTCFNMFGAVAVGKQKLTMGVKRDNKIKKKIQKKSRKEGKQKIWCEK